MIVIIEGIDRVGKTTLKNKLANYGFKPLNSLIEHRYLDDATKQLVHNERIFAALDVLKLVDNENIVIDRFHWSQYVYGKVDRGIRDESMCRVDSDLARLNAVVVLVDPKDVIWSSYQHGSSLEEHQAMFDNFYKTSPMKKTRLTYEEFDKIFDKLADARKEGNNGN